MADVHIYPIAVIRIIQEDGEDEQRWVHQRTYSHKEDLTQFDNTRKRKIASILEQIASNQPKNIPDSKVIEYFENQMEKKGFKPAKTHGLKIEKLYAYTFRD